MVKPIFKPIKQEKLSVKIVNQIKTLIIEGDLKPGDPLPPERELIRLLSVSRPSLREALKSLVGMGFLQTTQGNRTIVKSLASGRILEPLRHLMQDDIRIVFELIEVRKALEAWNAYYAALRATAVDIQRLEENISDMRAKQRQNLSSMEQDDADFHLAIAEATHNKVQTHIMFTIYDILKSAIENYYADINQEDVYQQHLAVVKAIKAGNADRAREKILEHLDYVESRVKRLVNRETDPSPAAPDSKPAGLQVATRKQKG